MNDLRACSWPISKLPDGLFALASAAGLDPQPAAQLPTALAKDRSGRLIEIVAGAHSIKAARVSCAFSELDDFFRLSAPSLIQLPATEGGEFLLLLGSTRGVIWVLGQDLARHAVRTAKLKELLSRGSESPLADSISRLLNGADLNGRRSRPRTLALRQQLRTKYTALWTLDRPSVSASALRLAQRAHLGRYLASFLVCYLAQYSLLLASWWLIGAAALRGYIDIGWLEAWGLLLLTRVPLVALSSWYQGLLAARTGSLLKQRLLEGTFHLEPEDVKSEGVGQTLSRVMESETMETLALGGGFLALVAIMELLAAAVVLALGAGGVLHLLALAVWILIAGWRGADSWRHRRRWTALRLGLTRSSIELMIGHRTRLAQGSGNFEVDAEDRELREYVQASEVMDRASAKLYAFLPRGWLLVGLLVLVPGFVADTSTTVGLAVAIGGILLAYRALERAVSGFTMLADAIVAWRETAALFKLGGRVDANVRLLNSELEADVGNGSPSGSANGEGHLLEAHGLEFAYGGGPHGVVRNCSLRIDPGDRVFVESMSGAGSSSLVSLIGGLRRQTAGVLLVDGLDRATLGDEGWARLVTTVAQPHENHVFSNTLAFNLLMGRRWPPEPEDLKDAEAVCRELGLAPLLQRMPGGMHQLIGDTGWQLSQGEKARLFIARALLQGARVVVLDAALSSLDADALHQVLNCVSRRSASVLVTTLVGDARP